MLTDLSYLYFASAELLCITEENLIFENHHDHVFSVRPPIRNVRDFMP